VASFSRCDHCNRDVPASDTEDWWRVIRPEKKLLMFGDDPDESRVVEVCSLSCLSDWATATLTNGS
jgi:hypothetical protein